MFFVIKSYVFARITHESLLWRLYDLYGFNIINDLVHNFMHYIPLNLLKKFIEELLHNTGDTTAKRQSLKMH